MRKARRPAGFSLFNRVNLLMFLYEEGIEFLLKKNLRYLQNLQEFIFLLQVWRITQILILYV